LFRFPYNNVSEKKKGLQCMDGPRAEAFERDESRLLDSLQPAVGWWLVDRDSPAEGEIPTTQSMTVDGEDSDEPCLTMEQALAKSSCCMIHSVFRLCIVAGIRALQSNKGNHGRNVQQVSELECFVVSSHFSFMRNFSFLVILISPFNHTR